MGRHSILHAPALAFYSRDFYREVAAEWRGTTFTYLLLLLAVCWLPTGYQLQRGWSQFVDVQSARIVDQIPPISIKGGVVSVDAKQPYYITDPDSRKVLAIIDTTGQVGPLDRTGAVVFLGNDQIMIQKGPQETRVYRLNGVDELHIDRDIVRLWLNRSKYVAGPLIYPFILAGSYVYRVLEILALASVAALFSREFRPRPGFGALLGLSVLAVTPPIVLATALDLAKVTLPRSWLVFLTITLGYLVYGVGTIRPVPGGADGAPAPVGPPPPWNGPAGPGG